MRCDSVRAALHPYLDGELEAGDVLAVEAHLMDCAECRAEYAALRGVVDTLRGARPLYEAPERLSTAVGAACIAHRKRAGWRRGMLAAAAVVLVGVLLAAVGRVRATETSKNFAAFAAEAHNRYAHGLLPLDVASSDPQVINNFFASRVAFRFQLPDYRSFDGGYKRYTLTGARLLQFKDGDAGYVAYAMNSRPISLITVPAGKVTLAGGEVYRSGGIDFHLSTRNGYRVMAWTDRGLSYALVSDVTVNDAQSCGVCHGTDKDREKIENLRRLPAAAVN